MLHTAFCIWIQPFVNPSWHAYEDVKKDYPSCIIYPHYVFFLITSAKRKKKKENPATCYELEMQFQRVQIVSLRLKQNSSFRVHRKWGSTGKTRDLLGHTLKWSCLRVKLGKRCLSFYFYDPPGSDKKTGQEKGPSDWESTKEIKEKQTQVVNTNNSGSRRRKTPRLRAGRVMNQPVIDVTYINPPLLPPPRHDRTHTARCETNTGSDLWYREHCYETRIKAVSRLWVNESEKRKKGEKRNWILQG